MRAAACTCWRAAGGERREGGGVGRRAAGAERQEGGGASGGGRDVERGVGGRRRSRGGEPKGGVDGGALLVFEDDVRRRARASRGAAEFGSLPASGSVALLVRSELANEREWGRQREL